MMDFNQSTLLEGNNNESEVCAYHDPYTTTRFVLISIASLVAFTGIITNLTLVTIFIKLAMAEEQWNSSRLYLTFLSFCDACFCFAFCAVFGLDAVYIYLHVISLFYVYFSIIVLTFTLSRLVQMAIPYFIIIATFERWLLSGSEMYRTFTNIMTSNPCRYLLTAAICIIAVVIRLPSGWAYYVKDFPDCNETFGSLQMYPTLLVLDPLYGFVSFYVVNILGVFIPFAVLLPLNIAIRNNIKRAQQNKFRIRLHTDTQESIAIQQNQQMSPKRPEPNMATFALDPQASKRKAQMRERMITMLVLVSSYLLCNTPHFILTIFEQFIPSFIYNEDGSSTALYLIWSDMVSVLFMFSSFLRFFIFYSCNVDVRKEVRKIWCCRSKRQRLQNETSIFELESTGLLSTPVENASPTYV